MRRITKLGSATPLSIATTLLGLGAFLCLVAGSAWLFLGAIPAAVPPTVTSYALTDPIFQYSPGWQVTPQGADPRQPADPWREPAGVVTFTVTAAEIDLRLAVGDYWGYLYVTVDGAPANALPRLAGNGNSLGQAAGYTTLYAPERQTATGPGEVWVTVARAQTPAPHVVRVEVWRSWGQMPLRGVAVRAAPQVVWPRWPGVLLVVLGFWCLVGFVYIRRPGLPRQVARLRWLFPVAETPLPLAVVATLSGMILVALGVAGTEWRLVFLGLGLIGLAALVRPALWSAALLCGLPFYFRFPLPVLPGRALGLIEVGVWGGLALLAVRTLVRTGATPTAKLAPSDGGRTFRWHHASPIALAALVSWALVSTFAAEHFAIALREWRTLFLTGGLFALILSQTLQRPNRFPNSLTRDRAGSGSWSLTTDHWLLLAGWLTGAGIVALVALGQYGTGQNLITAEGVWRVRAFYGSPNNLALYLERTLAVTLALLIWARPGRAYLLWGSLALIQGAALVLTFSKGALLLGLPALLATLGLGSLVILRQQRRSLTLLWWVVGAAVLLGAALVPFSGAERFQRLLDFQQGTGFVRLQLWRSAWQMALDHLWLGVGPDNFLYQYRSHYLLPAAWQEPNLNHPHNWLLDWWTRLGLPGLALALLFLGSVAYRLWENIRKGMAPALSVGLLAALVGALAHGLIDASYALPDLLLVWVLIASLASQKSSEQ